MSGSLGRLLFESIMTFREDVESKYHTREKEQFVKMCEELDESGDFQGFHNATHSAYILKQIQSKMEAVWLRAVETDKKMFAV